MTEFTWNTSVGVWAVAANWLDVTDGDVVAPVPPGAFDSATISGSNGATITGPGASSNLSIETNVALNGTFATSTLTVGQADDIFGALDLSAGSTLSASSVAVMASGLLFVSGNGAALTDTGTLTVGSSVTPNSYISPDLQVADHARIQANGLTLLGGFPAVSVDGTSTLEVGNAGTATAGALTVDGGAILSGAGSLTGTNVINNGTVVASSGTLSVGTVSGSGTLEVDTGATLNLFGLNNNINNALNFTGSDASLELGLFEVQGTTTGNFHGVISGFAAGDTIFPEIQADLATWTPSDDGLGTLAIYNAPLGSVSEGTPPPPIVTLILAGDYTGQTFYVVPTALQSSLGDVPNPGQAILLGATPGSGPAPTGTTGGDSYQWIGASGAWGNVNNWRDSTARANPAIVAPGSLDAVTIVGGTGASLDLVTGPGDASDLNITNAVALGGTFTTDILNLGTAAGSDGTLDLLADTTVSTGTVAVADGSLVITGIGANLIDSGAMTLGTTAIPDAPGVYFDNGFLTVSNHASAHVASLTMNVATQVLSGNLAHSVASVSVDDTSILEVGADGEATAPGLNVDADGTIAGAGSISGSIVDNGVIVASDGTLSLGVSDAPDEVGGNGALQIDASATLAIAAGSVDPAIDFAGPGADLLISAYQPGGLEIGQPETFLPQIAGSISDFAVGDTISLGFTASAPLWTPTGGGMGQLVVDGDFALNLVGNYSQQDFVLTQQSGSEATITLACFRSGSHILTQRGWIAVEDLRLGEHVVTRDGAMPVRWIGHREIDLSRHPRPEHARPVRIRRGAFGDDVPHCDLLISPDHAVFIEDILIPIKYLLNGTTIVVDHTINRPCYYHLEFDEHAIVFAEGLMVESLLPHTDRSVFDNGGVSIQLHPDLRTLAWEAHGYAQLVVLGARLNRIRKKLAAYATLRDCQPQSSFSSSRTR